MPTAAILNSHNVSALKKELSKTNIKGYSKLTKSKIIILMMQPLNRPRFHHIKMVEKKEKKKEATIAAKAKPVKKRVKKKPPLGPQKTAGLNYDDAVKKIFAKIGSKMFEKMVSVNEDVYLASLKSRSAMEAMIRTAMIKLFKAKKLTTTASMVDYGLKTRLNDFLDDIDDEIPEKASMDGRNLFEAVKEVKRLKQSNGNPQDVRAAIDKMEAIRKKLPTGYVVFLGKRVVPKNHV